MEKKFKELQVALNNFDQILSYLFEFNIPPELSQEMYQFIFTSKDNLDNFKKVLDKYGIFK